MDLRFTRGAQRRYPSPLAVRGSVSPHRQRLHPWTYLKTKHMAMGQNSGTKKKWLTAIWYYVMLDVYDHSSSIGAGPLPCLKGLPSAKLVALQRPKTPQPPDFFKLKSSHHRAAWIDPIISNTFNQGFVFERSFSLFLVGQVERA